MKKKKLKKLNLKNLNKLLKLQEVEEVRNVQQLYKLPNDQIPEAKDQKFLLSKYFKFIFYNRINSFSYCRQTDTEPSGSVIDEDREIYNDFDDISSPPHSPVHPIVLELPTEMPSADAAAENNDAIPETPQTRNEENAVETPAANPARVIDEIQPVGTINDANLYDFIN